MDGVCKCVCMCVQCACVWSVHVCGGVGVGYTSWLLERSAACWAGRMLHLPGPAQLPWGETVKGTGQAVQAARGMRSKQSQGTDEQTRAWKQKVCATDLEVASHTLADCQERLSNSQKQEFN